MGVRTEVRRVVRETWREVRDENVTFMAGSIAYHAFVSMLPLLLFLLLVLSAVGNAEFTARLVALTETVLTPYARELLVESLDVATARTGISLVGAITLLWGAAKIFRGLDVAFARIYDTDPRRSPLTEFRNAVVVLFTLTVAVAVFLVAGLAAAFVPDLPFPVVLNPFLLVVGLAIAFVPIYYVFPTVDLTTWEILPGVTFAAVGWTTLEVAFQTYVRFAARYEAVYGTLGSAFLLLIWLYFSGLVLLVGGVLNAVLAGRTNDEHALAVTAGVSARSGDADGNRDGPPDDRDELARAHERLGRAYERLDADHQRLREEVQRLQRENDRLRRENEQLTRQLVHRRLPVWARAKRWVVGERK
jgi:membrane protein